MQLRLFDTRTPRYSTRLGVHHPWRLPTTLWKVASGVPLSFAEPVIVLLRTTVMTYLLHGMNAENLVGTFNHKVLPHPAVMV